MKNIGVIHVTIYILCHPKGARVNEHLICFLSNYSLSTIADLRALLECYILLRDVNFSKLSVLPTILYGAHSFPRDSP